MTDGLIARVKMSGAGVEGIGASEGPTLSQLVESKLEELRQIDGVTSAKMYARKLKEPLNKSMINVRIAGRPKPVTVHCKAAIPNLLVAVHTAAEEVAKVLGSEAVAEGRRRAEAEREVAAPDAAAAASEQLRPSEQPLNLFELSARVQELEAKIKRADERMRDADGDVRSALLRVVAEEQALKQAQQRLASARAAAEAAQEPLIEAKAAVAELRASLEQLRSKRQRLSEELQSTSADAGASPSEPACADVSEVSTSEMYKEYSLETFRKLETEEARRRAVIPERNARRKPPRTGKDGALWHWRRGLVGAVQSWADGSLENVVILVMLLINHFAISDRILELIGEHDSGVPARATLAAKDPPLPTPILVAAACLSQVLTHSSLSCSRLRFMHKNLVPRSCSERSTT